LVAALSLDKFHSFARGHLQVNGRQGLIFTAPVVAQRVRQPIAPSFSFTFTFPKLKFTNTTSTHLLGIYNTHRTLANYTRRNRNDMASDVTTPDESCLLFKLPPELRLRVYYYTHQLRLDNDDYPDSSTEALNKSWASSWETTPLVQLAATCHLIANEVRHVVRSLPSSQRVAHVEISGATHEQSMQVHLRHLPCPLIDLRHIIITYDVRSPSSAESDVDAAMAFREAICDLGGGGLGYMFYSTLRRFTTHEALGKAAELESLQLRLTGLQQHGCQESSTQAVQGILDLQRPEGSVRLAQKILCCRLHEHIERDEVTLRLSVFNGRSLHLLV
jgi:hypothetical protein